MPTGNKRREKRAACLFRNQLRSKWVVTLLLWLSLSGVVAVHTYARNSARFQERSIQLIMKNAGHNLWFLDESADFSLAASGGPGLPAFSEDRVRQLAEDRGIASTYWGNVLQWPFSLGDGEVLLTGIEVVDDHQVTEERSHLLEPLEPGTVALGHLPARERDLSPGDTLSIHGREYEVRAVYPQRGNLDDKRLWVPLVRAQEWLGKPGQANLILGFLCMRGLSLDEGLRRLRERVAGHHPGLQVVPLMNILEARELARLTTSGYLDQLMLVVFGVTALLLAAFGWMEVNERRGELAILLSMGASYRFLARLFFFRLLLIALASGLAGFLAGSFLSVRRLSPILITHTMPVSVIWPDLPRIVAATLLLAAVSAVPPFIRLLVLEPTRVLAEER